MNLFNAHVVDEYHTKIVIFADISNNGEKELQQQQQRQRQQHKKATRNLPILQNKHGLKMALVCVFVKGK